MGGQKWKRPFWGGRRARFGGESGQLGPLGLAYDVGVPAPVPGGRRDSRSHFFAGWGGGGSPALWLLSALLASVFSLCWGPPGCFLFLLYFWQRPYRAFS